MGSGGLRLLGSQAQQNPAASLFNNGTPNSNTIYTSPANSNMTFSHPNSGLGFSGTNGSQLGYGSGLGLGPAQPQSTMGYGSSSMGPIGASLSAIGTSMYFKKNYFAFFNSFKCNSLNRIIFIQL